MAMLDYRQPLRSLQKPAMNHVFQCRYVPETDYVTVLWFTIDVSFAGRWFHIFNYTWDDDSDRLKPPIHRRSPCLSRLSRWLPGEPESSNAVMENSQQNTVDNTANGGI